MWIEHNPPRLIDWWTICSDEKKTDWCWEKGGGKSIFFFVTVIQALLLSTWLFSNWCVLIGEGEGGPGWWEWHDGSWVADQIILWLSWRFALLVWLLTQIECSQRRGTPRQTQGQRCLSICLSNERHVLYFSVFHASQTVWSVYFSFFNARLFKKSLGNPPCSATVTQSTHMYLSVYNE